MKMVKRTEEQIKVELAKSPIREIGKWTKICEEVKKSGQAVELTEITRGQAWSIKRKAKETGIHAKVTKEGNVLLFP
jgi:hypothetical protein